MEKLIGIYKITNPKGKIYIGRSINIKKRWDEHRYYTKSLIYRSIQKYGYSSHKFEVIHTIEKIDHDELNNLEIYYIELFNSCNLKIGLNLSHGGGRLGFKHSNETIEKMKKNRIGWQNSLGRVLSEETKAKISNSLKGNIISEKTRQNQIMSCMLNNRSDIIIDKETGVFYYSTREAAKFNNINRCTLMYRIKMNYGNLIKA